jgi:hypothetical protein
MRQIREGAIGTPALEIMKQTMQELGSFAPLAAGNHLIAAREGSSVFRPPQVFVTEQLGRVPNLRRPGFAPRSLPPILGRLAEGVGLEGRGPTMDLKDAPPSTSSGNTCRSCGTSRGQSSNIH